MLDILRRSLVWIAGVALILLGTFLIVCNHLNSGKVVTLPGAGELVVMDELSLWNVPANSGISYSGFEPLRVRDEGAEYFLRTDRDKHLAASGHRYGEIKLTQQDGGLTYLPRFLAYDRNDSLKLFLQKSSQKGRWQISIYPTSRKVAHVTATSPGVTITPAGTWDEVTIKLSTLKLENFARPIPDRQKVRDANFLLSQYLAPKGTFYGIGFSLLGGSAKDSLFIDRIVVEKAEHTKANQLTGQLTPPVIGADIVLRSDNGEAHAKTKWNGSFRIEVPQNAKVVEIVAQTDHKVMSPRTGRFMEIGSYLPKVIIPSRDEVLQAHTLKDDSNASLYIYEKKYGPRIEPDQHFLVQINIRKDQVTAAELATNHLGYIDRDHRAENPDRAYRIMLLGDSHHMGVHLAQSDSWWNEADAVASMAVRRPVEIISASFHHASWTSSWPAFRDLGADMKPDITLIPVIDPVIFNLGIEEFMMRWLGAAKDHRPAYQFELTTNGALVHKPNDPDWQLYRSSLTDAEQKRIRAQYTSNPYIHADPAQDPQWVNDSIKLATASLAEFGKLAKQRHERFGLLYISNFGSSKTGVFTEDGVAYDPNRLRSIVQKMAKDAGIEFIDISNDIHMKMEGRDASRVYFYSDGHFTPYGHYRYGQALGALAAKWAEGQ